MKLTDMQKNDLRQSFENAIGLWERSGDASTKLVLEAVPKDPSSNAQIHIVVSFPRHHVVRIRGGTLMGPVDPDRPVNPGRDALDVPSDVGRGD